MADIVGRVGIVDGVLNPGNCKSFEECSASFSKECQASGSSAVSRNEALLSSMRNYSDSLEGTDKYWHCAYNWMLGNGNFPFTGWDKTVNKCSVSNYKCELEERYPVDACNKGVDSRIACLYGIIVYAFDTLPNSVPTSAPTMKTLDLDMIKKKPWIAAILASPFGAAIAGALIF